MANGSFHMNRASQDDKYGVPTDEEKQSLRGVGDWRKVREGIYYDEKKRTKRRKALKALKPHIGGRFSKLDVTSQFTEG